MTTAFVEFVDRKHRESQKQLNLVKKLFDKVQMHVTAHLDDENPYIFLQNPTNQLSFEGVRIYKIGDTIAYRVQKKADTLPYGRAYPLDLEEMFEDYMEDSENEDDAARKIVQSVAQEMKKFFEKSLEAEKEIRSSEIDSNDPNEKGKIILKTTGSDYSSMINSKM